MQHNSKRGWTSEEDRILLQAMENSQSHMKWVEVARILQQSTGRTRTGKQCRERWQHQLNPNITHAQWTNSQAQKVFEEQRKLGNKWAQIADKIPGRTDNAVKNFFYAAIRRVFTRLNSYLVVRRHQLSNFRNIREFESDFLSKLMAVVDGSFSKKLRISSEEIVQVARRIVIRLTDLLPTVDNQENNGVDQQMDELVIDMQHFRKNCKKRKQSKGHTEEDLVDEYMVEQRTKSTKCIVEQEEPLRDEQSAPVLIGRKSSIFRAPSFMKRSTSLFGMLRMEDPIRNNSLHMEEDFRMEYEESLNQPIVGGLDFNNIMEASFNFHNLTNSRDLGLSSDLFPQFNL